MALAAKRTNATMLTLTNGPVAIVSENPAMNDRMVVAINGNKYSFEEEGLNFTVIF